MAHLEYCSNCGKKNTFALIEGVKRFHCTHCHTIHYENPKPAATLICPRKSEILLVKRAFEPAKGHWCLPGGFLEMHETPEEAALRELREETGLTGRVVHFLGHCSHFGTVFGDILLLAMVVNIEPGQEIICGDDAAEARYFPITQLPQLAFYCHDRFIEMYHHMSDREKSDQYRSSTFLDERRG